MRRQAHLGGGPRDAAWPARGDEPPAPCNHSIGMICRTLRRGEAYYAGFEGGEASLFSRELDGAFMSIRQAKMWSNSPKIRDFSSPGGPLAVFSTARDRRPVAKYHHGTTSRTFPLFARPRKLRCWISLIRQELGRDPPSGGRDWPSRQGRVRCPSSPLLTLLGCLDSGVSWPSIMID